MSYPIYTLVEFVSVNSFAVSNAAQNSFVSEFLAGLRIKADCGVDGIFQGAVTGATHDVGTGRTTVVVALDGMMETLTANLTGVVHGCVAPGALCAHGHTGPADGGTLESLGLVVFATSNQVLAGTETGCAVTPAALRGGLIGTEPSQVSSNAMLGTGAFQDLQFVDASFEYDPASLASAAMTTLAGIAVPGAEFGDFVYVSAPYSLQGLVVNCYVSAVDTCELKLYNFTGATVNLSSGAWNIRLMKLIPMRDE